MKSAPAPIRAVFALMLAAAALLAGCGTSERDRVQAKVEQFAQAAASRDYATICGQVLAPALLARMTGGGIPCEQAMALALGSVQNPTLSIGSISIHGRAADVITLTAAQGQRAAISTLELVQTDVGWRISSLSARLPRRP